MKPEPSLASRRALLRFVAASPLLTWPTLSALGNANAADPGDEALDGTMLGGELMPGVVDDVLNVFQMREIARGKIHPDAWAWLSTGSDGGKTLAANRKVFDQLQIRIRRLIDVRTVDTAIEIFGERYASPILLAPIGIQSVFHPEAELPVARAAASQGHRMIAANLSSVSFEELAAAGPAPWFQLYTRWDRGLIRDLLQRVAAAGCPAITLTTDTPIGGHRETAMRAVIRMVQHGPLRFGNIAEKDEPLADTNPGLSWEYVDWLRGVTPMKVLIKGIVTREDALLAREHGADGLIVSNHGGRQEESGRSTLESLPEVLEAVDGSMPVLVDSGFRRGTDIFKALALGARAVCIGRPQVWGLGAFGQAGVEQVLGLLQAELVRIMRFAGTTSIAQITRDRIQATAACSWLPGPDRS